MTEKKMSNQITMSDKRKKSTSSKKMVAQLKAVLPRDYSKTIENKMNVTRRTVTKVLNEFDTSHPIMGELVQLAEQEIKRRKDIESKIENLIN
jgi:hypothetical protein